MSSDRNLYAEIKSRCEEICPSGKNHLPVIQRLGRFNPDNRSGRSGWPGERQRPFRFRCLLSHLSHSRDCRIHPYADPCGKSQLRHVVNDYVVPSIAVVQVTDSPFLGVVADIGIENPHHLVFIRKGVVSFEFSPESLPVLIHRLKFDLIPVQRRPVRDIVDEKAARRLCSLAGKPHVSLIHTFRRSVRAYRDTVNLR